MEVCHGTVASNRKLTVYHDSMLPFVGFRQSESSRGCLLCLPDEVVGLPDPLDHVKGRGCILASAGPPGRHALCHRMLWAKCDRAAAIGTLGQGDVTDRAKLQRLGLP